MPDGHVSPREAHPKLIVALGRQRVGKTALLNALIQFCGERGSTLVLWNADEQNKTHSLSTFYDRALRPPTGGLTDTKAWLEERLFDQVQQRYHAVLDPGGGATGFSSLIEEVPILPTLGDHGIDVVALFCIGPEQADLDYLDRCATSESFLPSATMIVLNAGLVMSGRSSEVAFQRMVATPVVRGAIGRGARMATMPALPCMSQVTDRGISFADASENRVKPGQEPLQLFDPLRVKEWWTKRMPSFFEKFPEGWLPMAGQVVNTESTTG